MNIRKYWFLFLVIFLFIPEGHAFAEDVTFALGLVKSKNHKFRTKFTYRKLEILEPTFTSLQPEENVLARVEYVAKFLKRVISSNTYFVFSHESLPQFLRNTESII